MVKIIIKHNAQFSVLILTHLIQTTLCSKRKDYALKVYLLIFRR